MSRRLAFLVLLLAPAVGRADDPPERLLSAGTQFYFRWDGVGPHRAAYEKTAIGQTIQGDSGKFLTGLYRELIDNAGTLLTVPQLLGGATPEQLKVLQGDIVEAPKLLPGLAENGFIAAVELRTVLPPAGQVTLILPGAGAQPKPFLSTVRLIAFLAKQEIKETKIGDRTVYHAGEAPLFVAWWIDGKDAIVVAGSDKPEAIVKRASATTDRLADNAQFAKLREFKEFPTASRGFIDGTALVKFAKGGGEPVAKIIGDLGLDGLQAIRFYSGFDGPADRGLVEIDMPGPRKGLLRLADNKPFKLADLPALPPDLISFSAARFDAGNFYDAGVQAIEAVVRTVAPDELKDVQAGLKKADQTLGVNIRGDLLGSLGDLFVTYNSPTDGPVNLGQVVLLRVKDPKKLQTAIEQLVKGLGAATGAEATLHKRTYRKVELCEVHVKQQGFAFLPTYAIHDGWLVVGFYPQPVQGYLLRATGELPAWKPGPEVQASLAKLPAEFTFLAVSDPRPSIKTVLSLAPFVASLLKSLSPETKFDIGALPNPHEATKHLFPNVLMATDNGTTVRFQSRTSLLLPFDAVGADSFYLGSVLAIALRFGGF